MCVRLDLGWTPFSWVANALDVSCVTSSDIDSFHQEAGGWGWCLLDPPALPSSHDHSQHTRDHEVGRGDSSYLHSGSLSSHQMIF